MIVTDINGLRFFIAARNNHYNGAGAYVVSPAGGVYILQRDLNRSQVYHSAADLWAAHYTEVKDRQAVLTELGLRNHYHWRSWHHAVQQCDEQELIDLQRRET